MSVNRGKTLFRSRVARRIFGLFILSALVPVGVLAVAAYLHVAGQLDEQTRERLRQASKWVGMAIIERLNQASSELASLVPGYSVAPEADLIGVANPSPGREVKFTRLTVATPAGHPLTASRASPIAPALTDDQAAHLRRGAPLAAVDFTPEPRVWLGIALDPTQLARGILWGELDGEYLFAGGPSRPSVPAETEMCAFFGTRASVYCTTPVSSSLAAAIADSAVHGGQLRWTGEADTYIAGAWSIFLKASFGAPTWTVVLSQAEAVVHGPTKRFRQSFPLAVALALVVVLLGSHTQIRRILDPLVRLEEATRNIAARVFDRPVVVTSGDEFEDLAASFNDMSHQLGSQFRALTVGSEIDRAVLSALNTSSVVETILARGPDVVECDTLAVALALSAESRWLVYRRGDDGRLVTQRVELSEPECQELSANPRLIVIGAESSRSYLSFARDPAFSDGEHLVAPISIGGRSSALVAFGSHRSFDETSHVQARKLADHLALALANTQLIEELDELSWGALTALARTIDAKSPWTSGHSERVTRVAKSIGIELGLSKDQMKTLHRGGLLHDIGKIGIAARILDKAGRLTDEEMEIMKSHPTIGARILAPIAAYQDALPIVLHHHERYDGLGYPAGLAREAIPYLARVLAVADVWDALTSDRPYRLGWSHDNALEFIRNEASKMFDPKVVEAFLIVIDRQGGRADATPKRAESVVGGEVTAAPYAYQTKLD